MFHVIEFEIFGCEEVMAEQLYSSVAVGIDWLSPYETALISL
jgi:hypothetical protein